NHLRRDPERKCRRDDLGVRRDDRAAEAAPGTVCRQSGQAAAIWRDGVAASPWGRGDQGVAGYVVPSRQGLSPVRPDQRTLATLTPTGSRSRFHHLPRCSRHPPRRTMNRRRAALALLLGPLTRGAIPLAAAAEQA